MFENFDPVSSNSSSQAISSDHCYGLPYQDHNYGSAMSPSLGNRVSHSRGNHHMQTPAAHLSRTRITVETTPASFPSLAGPPSLERNSCSDDENVGDPLLFAQTATTSPNFMSSMVGAAHSTGFKSSPVVSTLPPGGITVCSSAVVRPRIKRVVMEDASHSYASSGGETQLAFVKPQQGTIMATGTAPNANHPQKVAVFRRFPGASGTTIQVNGPPSIMNPPNLVSTSTTGAPTFSGSIVGPGLMAPVIAISGELVPPPKRPGRPRGARVGGQQQQRQPRQPKRKKSRQLAEGGPNDFINMPPHVLSSVELVSSPPPAAAHESVIPDSMVCMLSSSPANCLGEVAQSIESVLQSVSSSADQGENSYNIHHQQTTSYVSAAAKKSANVGETDFAETYKSLYDRLFKQLGVPDDEDIDLDRPVGASRSREPFVRLTSPKKSPPFASASSSKSEMQMASKEGLSPKSVGGSNTDTDESSDDEWAGQDYTTRCVCQLTHNDDFMIQCDRCESWQHCDCVGLQKKFVPEHYLCELCDPRPLKYTKEEAQKLQMKKLQKRKRQKAARKRLSSSSGSVGRGRPRKNTGDSTVGKPIRRPKQLEQEQADEDLYSTFIQMETNEYTNEVMKAIRLCGDSVGAGLLDQLPTPPPCLVMYVTKERRGLVANKTVPPDQPVMEFRGKISSTSEFNGRNKSGRIYPCVMFYRGLSKGGGVDGMSPLDLCIDARYRGTDARFVRRSCQPNTQVKHVIKNDQVHLLLISTELIESATELTIPFDFDYRLCNYEVECGCKIWGNGECPVDRFNSQLVISPPTAPKKTVSIVAAHKRRSNLIGGASSAKKTSTNFQRKKVLSGSKKTSKFVKKGVGFKVKLKDKSDSLFRSKYGKHAKKMAKKKLKPVASADLTRRRSSAVSESEPAMSSGPSSPALKAKKEIKEEAVVVEKIEEPTRQTLASPRPTLASPKPKQVSRNGTERESSCRVSFSAGDDAMSPDNHLLSREEKKMQQLMEQIARMEEREKKKEEKRTAKHKEDEKSPLSRTKSFSGPIGEETGKIKSSAVKTKKKRGRRPSANNLSDRRRGDQIMMSNSDGDSNSGESSDDDIKQETAKVSDNPMSPKVLLVEQPSVTFVSNVETTAASITSQRKSSALDVERNVAKKRWLRQAMSEENVVNTSPMNSPTLEIKTLPEITSPAPLSPPTAPPLKKRKLTANQSGESEPFNIITLESVNNATESANVDASTEVPLSTTEAAELLALMQQSTHVTAPLTYFVTPETFVAEPELPQETTDFISNFEQTSLFSEPQTIVEQETAIGERCGTPVQDEKEETALDEPIAQPSAIFPPPSVTYDCVEFYSEPLKDEQDIWNEVGGFKTDPPQQISAPEPRKKVKMSLDEYKKRKRDHVNDGDVASIETSQDSADSLSTSTPVAPSPSTPSTQRTLSFIPKIKEGEMEAKPIRLGTLPDPSLIGKTSTTLDELRQRIYGHSFSKQAPQQQLADSFSSTTIAAEMVESPQDLQMQSISPEPLTNKMDFETGDSSAPSQHRMSLMDRLRMEFGLEDAAAAPQLGDNHHQHNVQQQHNQQQQYNLLNNPALAMIQNVRNSFQQQASYARPPSATGGNYRNFSPSMNAMVPGAAVDHRPPPLGSLPVPFPAPAGPPPPEIQRVMSAVMGAMMGGIPRPPAPPPLPNVPNLAPSRRTGSGRSDHGSISSSDDEREPRESSSYRRNYFRRRSKSPNEYSRRRR